jgi:hypothetical protein
MVVRASRGRDAPRDPGRAFRGAAMLLTLPLALVAVVIYWLPYQLPRFVTRRLKGDPDETSTYKLGVGLVVYPIWAAAAIVLAFLRLPSTELAALATVLVLASPFAALAWLDRWDRLAARASMLAPPSEQRERLVALASERAEIMREIETLGDRALQEGAA